MLSRVCTLRFLRSKEAFIDVEVFTLGFFGINAFEIGGVVLFVGVDFVNGAGVFGVEAAPDDVAVLEVDILSGVIFHEFGLVVAVVEGLFTGCLTEQDDAFFVANFSGVKFGQWRFEAAQVVIDVVEIDSSKSVFCRDCDGATVSAVRGIGPVEGRVGAHEVGAAGVGGDDVIACDEGVTDAALAAPFGFGLAGEGVDDVEAGVGDLAKVGQDVGEADGVMEIGSDTAMRWNGWKAEEVFEAEGDAHESVAFHFGERDKGVGFAEGGGELVFGEHDATAGDFVLREGRITSFDVGDVEFFEEGAHVKVGAGAFAWGCSSAGVEDKDVGLGAFF